MEKVIFEKSGALARVTINRPERMNACDFETYRLLGEAWREIDRDPEIRVAILTGAGERAFCAGSDIKSDYIDSGSGRHAAVKPAPKSAGGDSGERADEVQKDGPEASGERTRGFVDVRKPVIAAINGHANGGGLEQALACDIRVAAEHAQFGLGEVRLGWLPGGGGTQRLPRILPLGRALEMLYTGNRIDAAEAFRLQLVDYVVPIGELMSKAEQIAGEICKSAPLAVQRIKEVALRGLDLPLEEGLRLEQEGFRDLMQTEDAVEGALAFAEKRPPRWSGK